tara:strand:+ start:9161 stop:10303 length:1143 start_codon:yes stop_codon:yes gene_type:complete
MATTFKTFLNNDITSTKTLLHEAIPLTGTIISGTYNTGTPDLGNATNIKNYAHGMYQSVYDYPYLSSSANHIFDLTVGYASSSVLSGAASVQNAKKINIYNQMAQVLVGYDQTGSIREFDEDGNFTSGGGTKMKQCVFINVARLLAKDEIKKGSFTLKIGTGSYDNAFSGTTHNGIVTVSDSGKENDYRVNSPAGEYAILSATLGYNKVTFPNLAPACGLIYYQAGIIVLTSSLFSSGSVAGGYNGLLSGAAESPVWAGGAVAAGGLNITASLTGSTISASCNNFRNRIYDMSFNNTTELNSTIHFARINHNDFNYSSNPTYLSSSKIVVKNNSLDAPISYLTTVGLYSSDNELLAVAKLSEPLKKDPTNEMTIRVRLDY